MSSTTLGPSEPDVWRSVLGPPTPAEDDAWRASGNAANLGPCAGSPSPPDVERAEADVPRWRRCSWMRRRCAMIHVKV